MTGSAPAAQPVVHLFTAVCLLVLIPAGPAHAGDEEINPSVYQVFDPETGYFIDVEPPPDEQQAAATQPLAPAGSGSDTGSGAQTPAASGVTATPEPQVGPQPAGNLDPMVLAGGAVIAAALAGLALRKRKGAD